MNEKASFYSILLNLSVPLHKFESAVLPFRYKKVWIIIPLNISSYQYVLSIFLFCMDKNAMQYPPISLNFLCKSENENLLGKLTICNSTPDMMMNLCHP